MEHFLGRHARGWTRVSSGLAVAVVSCSQQDPSADTLEQALVLTSQGSFFVGGETKRLLLGDGVRELSDPDLILTCIDEHVEAE